MSFIVTCMTVLLVAVVSSGVSIARRQFLAGSLAALGIVLSSAAFAVVPGKAANNAPPQLINVSFARLKDFWELNRDMLGDPISDVKTVGGYLCQDFRYYRMCAYPEQSDPYYKLQPALIGPEFLRNHGWKADAKATLHPVLTEVIAGQQKRGLDHLFWNGELISGPVGDGDDLVQCFQRMCYRWPKSSNDPSQAYRVDLGRAVLNIETTGNASGTVDWSTARQILTTLGGFATLASLFSLTSFAKWTERSLSRRQFGPLGR